MTKLEEIARAICGGEPMFGESEEFRAAYINEYWRRHIKTARNAVEAMRKPRAALIRVIEGIIADYERKGFYGDDDAPSLREAADATWQASIDAILNEKETLDTGSTNA